MILYSFKTLLKYWFSFIYSFNENNELNLKRLRRNIVVYILKILLIIIPRILNTTKYINERVQNRDDNKNEFSKNFSHRRLILAIISKHSHEAVIVLRLVTYPKYTISKQNKSSSDLNLLAHEERERERERPSYTCRVTNSTAMIRIETHIM